MSACLLVGWILLIGPPCRLLVLSRMSGIGLLGVVTLRRVYFGAYSKAGGPTEAGSAAFIGRGLLSHSDEVDVGSAQYFVDSSLAPVLFFFVGVLSLLQMS